jgi:hypothetical protein
VGFIGVQGVVDGGNILKSFGGDSDDMRGPPSSGGPMTMMSNGVVQALLQADG